MTRKLFTEDEQQLLRQNPYIYSVTATRITLTKEFKEIFFAAYNAGESPRRILEDHGFDISVIGSRRVWGISQHIRAEFQKHGSFHEGYTPRCMASSTAKSDQSPSDFDELKRLRHEVDYLKQEIDFLKKISSLKTSRK